MTISMFSEVKIHLNNGKTFLILAPNVSRKRIYVQSVRLNNVLYEKGYITHDQIMNGDTLFLEMGDKPGSIWYK